MHSAQSVLDVLLLEGLQSKAHSHLGVLVARRVARISLLATSPNDQWRNDHARHNLFELVEVRAGLLVVALDNLLEQVAERHASFFVLVHVQREAESLGLLERLALDAQRPRQLENQRWHVIHFHKIGRARVVMRPGFHEHLEVGSGDEIGAGVVERRKVLDDDGHHEIEEYEAAQNLEGDEEWHGHGRATVTRGLRACAAFLMLHRVGHDA